MDFLLNKKTIENFTGPNIGIRILIVSTAKYQSKRVFGIYCMLVIVYHVEPVTKLENNAIKNCTKVLCFYQFFFGFVKMCTLSIQID